MGCGVTLKYENSTGYCLRCRSPRLGPLLPLTDQEVGWIAGALDCDGCITINKSLSRRYKDRTYLIHRIIVSIGLVDLAPIQWWAARFPGSRYTIRAGRCLPNALPQHRWHASDSQAASLLTLVQPYLLIKAEQARIALALHATKKRYGSLGVPPDVLQLRDELHQQMRALNQRTALRQAIAEPDQDA